jgi:hypothetical protein
LDGITYEPVNRPFAGVGARLAASMRITEDPLTKMDNSLFPESTAAVPGNTTLRERTRTLIAANLDQMLPDYLKND